MGKFEMFIESEGQVKQMQDLLMKLYYQKQLAPEQVAVMKYDELAPAVQEITGEVPSGRLIGMIKSVARMM